MNPIDLNLEPPTSHEINAVVADLKRQRRRLIIRSCISDAIHLVLLTALYFGGVLSGRSLVVLITLSLVITMTLATSTRENLQFTDLLAIISVIVTTALAVALILGVAMSTPWPESLMAGLLSGSIATLGTILGRTLKKILSALDQYRTIDPDDPATEDLAQLCRRHPRLQEYREQAARNLRPLLTYGELAAMRKWHQDHSESKIHHRPA